MGKLNEFQERAVCHKDGPALVLAGPGSGKTTVVTRRVKQLVEEYQVPPGEILVITFTRAAAREMQARFEGLMDGRKLPVTFGTHDNYCTELIDFDIARIGLPYNAILGYPALAKFMAATHPAYNLMKMPGSSGVLTIAGDTKDPLLALKLALKIAAIA